jgi:predicted alpha/beta-fold hydrolase
VPVVASAYSPPALLRNGHLQTLLGAALPHVRLPVPVSTERIELRDGDFLDLRWIRTGSDRVAIVTHGLEGCADNRDVRGMAAALASARWDVLAWNLRGCGPDPNRLPRFYHSGDTADLATVIDRAAQDYTSIALVGFSLGANLTLKYLGEAVPHPAVAASVAISAPIDLAGCAAKLDRDPWNRLYLRRFMKTLVAKVKAKSLQFPGEIDVAGIEKIRTFGEFDDQFTAPLHGFANAAEYWSRSSALPLLSRITVPTLLLNARDDPFLAATCFPEDDGNPHLFIETPAHGGHLGFLQSFVRCPRWSEIRTAGFLNFAGRDGSPFPIV